MALLGKISAVLTANTQDFSRNIGTARRELNAFAQQARGLQLNLDNRALNQTLTQLQRAQRTIQQIERQRAQGLGAGLPDPARLRGQLRAFEDVGRPLTQLRSQIEGLSSSLQAQLYPELSRIQGGFQRLYNELGSGATTIAQAERRVDSLRESIIALGRATAATGDLGRLAESLNANNSGASFFQARARDSLQRSLDLRSRAQAVPAAFRSDAFADLAVQAEESAERVARAAARVTREQLNIANSQRNGTAVTPNQLLRRGIAQQRLNREVSQQELINNQFDRELRSAQVQQIIAPRAMAQVDVLIERLQTLAAEARTLGGNQFSGLINSASLLVDQLNRGAASAAAATRAVNQLDRALDSVRDGGPLNTLRQQTESMLFSQSDMMRRRVQSNYDSLTANRGADDPIRRRAEVERQIALDRMRLNDEVIPRTQRVAQQAMDSGDQGAITQANRLLEINRQINAELRRAENFSSNRRYDDAATSLRRVLALLQEQETLERRIAQDVQNANDARRQQELFLRASGGAGENLSQGARDAAADISVARQFRGQVANGGARIEIDQAIREAEKRVLNLQREMATVTNSGLPVDAMVADLDRLDNEIRQTTQGLARFIAVRSNGAFSEGQISTAMERARNTAGSITTRGAATVQLAAQQALFAIDDLISATGGLEYRLRAVGNNITQLGLLLGQSGVIPGLSATTGLLVGLGVVIGGQVVSALLRYVTGAQEAADITKALQKEFEKQKTLSSQVAQSFSQIGAQISSAGFSDAARAANDLADALEKISREQKKLLASQLLATDTAALRRAGVDTRLAARQDSEDLTPGEAIAIARQRAELARLRARDEGRLLEMGAPAPGDASALLRNISGRLTQANNQIRGIGGFGWSSTLDAIAQGLTFGNGGAQLLGISRPGNVALRAAATRASELSGVPLTGNAEEDRRAQLDAVKEIIERLKGVGTQQVFGTQTTAARAANSAIQELEQLRLRLEGDSDLEKLFEALKRRSELLAVAQERAASAISEGIPEAIALQSQLDGFQEAIRASIDAINQANADLEEGKIDVTQRNDIVRREEKKRADTVKENTAAREEVFGLARRAALDPSLSPKSISERVSRSLGDSGFGAGILARRLRGLEFDRQTQVGLLPFAQNDAEKQRIQDKIKRINDEILAIDGVIAKLNAFGGAFDKILQQVSADVSSLEQRADEARRASIGGRAGPNGALIAGGAEADFREARRRERQIQDDMDNARANAEQQLIRDGDAAARRRAEIDRQLAIPQDEIGPDGTRGGTAEERKRLIAERRRLDDEIQRKIEGSQEMQDLRRQRDEVTRQLETAQSVDRGRELQLSPAERAGRDLAQGLKDLQAAFEDDRRLGIAANPAALAEDQRRLVEEAFRATAPAMAALSDSVQNAVLQGPSRAALQVADTTTGEGARELNRLLRGDDAARNQNLVELQTQSRALQELVQIARENGAAAGVVDL